MPRLRMLVISDDSGQYDGKKGVTRYQQWALLDQSEPQEARMINTVDYRLSEEEKINYAGKCLGKVVIIDAKNFAIFNSRLQISQGKIVDVEGLKTAKAA